MDRILQAAIAAGEPRKEEDPIMKAALSVGADTRQPLGEEPGYIKTFAKGMTRGAEGLLASTGDVTRWAGDLINAESVSKAGTWWQKYWERAAQEGWEAPDPRVFRGDFLDNPSFKRAFGVIGEALPSLALAMGTSVGLGVAVKGAGLVAKGLKGAKAARKIGQFGGAGTLGLLEGAPQYREAIEAGRGEAAATALGALSVGATTAWEYLGLSILFGKVGGGVAKQAAIKGLSESTQEVMQTLTQNAIARFGYDDTRSLVEGIVEAAIGGAGVGAIASTTTTKLNEFLRKHPEATDEEIQEVHDMIEVLTENAAEQQEKQPDTDTTLEEDFKKTEEARKENGLGDDDTNKDIIAKVGEQTPEATEGKEAARTVEEVAEEPLPGEEEPAAPTPFEEEQRVEEVRLQGLQERIQKMREETPEIDEGDELEVAARKRVQELNARRADDIEREGTEHGISYLHEQDSLKGSLTGSLERYRMDKKGLAKGDKRYSEENVAKSKAQLEKRLGEDIEDLKYRPIEEKDYGGQDAKTKAGLKLKHFQKVDDIEVGLVMSKTSAGDKPSYWLAKHPEGTANELAPTMEGAVEKAKETRANELEEEDRRLNYDFTKEELDEEHNATLRLIAKERGIEKWDKKRFATLKREILEGQKKEEPAPVEEKKEEPVADFTPEQQKALPDIDVKIKGIREATGETIELKEKADVAMQEIDKSRSTYEKILNCLGS